MHTPPPLQSNKRFPLHPPKKFPFPLSLFSLHASPPNRLNVYIHTHTYIFEKQLDQKAFETTVSNLKIIFEKQLEDPAYDSETWINRIKNEWYQMRFEIEAKEKEEKRREEEGKKKDRRRRKKKNRRRICSGKRNKGMLNYFKRKLIWDETRASLKHCS